MLDEAIVAYMLQKAVRRPICPDPGGRCFWRLRSISSSPQGVMQEKKRDVRYRIIHHLQRLGLRCGYAILLLCRRLRAQRDAEVDLSSHVRVRDRRWRTAKAGPTSACMQRFGLSMNGDCTIVLLFTATAVSIIPCSREHENSVAR